MPVIATYVASTCVDYYFPLVLPFMGGRRGPVCIGPTNSDGSVRELSRTVGDMKPRDSLSLSPLLPSPSGTAPAVLSLARLWQSSSAASCISASCWVGVIVFYFFEVN